MKIGFIGLGKLGLPVALSVEDHGHEVFGFDISQKVTDIFNSKVLPYTEVGAQELLNKTKINLCELERVVLNSEIVFLAVQTPHQPEYEGVTRIPLTRADFDYSFLVEAVKNVVNVATLYGKSTTLVIISTVLPGTIKREILPLLNDKISLVYNPFFIAMGTVIPDFTNPEFVLLGLEDNGRRNETLAQMFSFYSTIHRKNFEVMPIVDAELTKVAYNTFIGSKIVFANTLMEICQAVGGNVDNVTRALTSATDRLISGRYMSAGMGDGGGCHPRDNIAMSYLAKTIGLSHNIFEDLMMAREDQTGWLASLIRKYFFETGLPIMILGRSFKPETNIETGSPAVLLANLLKEDKIPFDHFEPTTDDSVKLEGPHLFFIGTKHQVFSAINYPAGSIVLDPWGYIPKSQNYQVIHIGRHGL